MNILAGIKGVIMCKYCELDDCGIGKNLPFQNSWDIVGRAGIMTVVIKENDNFYIDVDSAHGDFKIKIEYCPICGRNLKENV